MTFVEGVGAEPRIFFVGVVGEVEGDLVGLGFELIDKLGTIGGENGRGAEVVAVLEMGVVAEVAVKFGIFVGEELELGIVFE